MDVVKARCSRGIFHDIKIDTSSDEESNQSAHVRHHIHVTPSKVALATNRNSPPNGPKHSTSVDVEAQLHEQQKLQYNNEKAVLLAQLDDMRAKYQSISASYRSAQQRIAELEVDMKRSQQRPPSPERGPAHNRQIESYEKSLKETKIALDEAQSESRALLELVEDHKRAEANLVAEMRTAYDTLERCKLNHRTELATLRRELEQQHLEQCLSLQKEIDQLTENHQHHSVLSVSLDAPLPEEPLLPQVPVVTPSGSVLNDVECERIQRNLFHQDPHLEHLELELPKFDKTPSASKHQQPDLANVSSSGSKLRTNDLKQSPAVADELDACYCLISLLRRAVEKCSLQNDHVFNECNQLMLDYQLPPLQRSKLSFRSPSNAGPASPQPFSTGRRRQMMPNGPAVAGASRGDSVTSKRSSSRVGESVAEAELRKIRMAREKLERENERMLNQLANASARTRSAEKRHR